MNEEEDCPELIPIKEQENKDSAREMFNPMRLLRFLLLLSLDI